MTREEILAKSRVENNNTDYAGLHLLQKASRNGGAAAMILCFFIYILKIVLGQGQDYALYSIIFCSTSVSSWCMYRWTKDKKHLATAVPHTLIAVLSLTVASVMIIKG